MKDDRTIETKVNLKLINKLNISNNSSMEVAIVDALAYFTYACMYAYLYYRVIKSVSLGLDS